MQNRVLSHSSIDPSRALNVTDSIAVENVREATAKISGPHRMIILGCLISSAPESHKSRHRNKSTGTILKSAGVAVALATMPVSYHRTHITVVMFSYRCAVPVRFGHKLASSWNTVNGLCCLLAWHPGKTLAYLLPVVERLVRRPPPGIGALVLAPTREFSIESASRRGVLSDRQAYMTYVHPCSGRC